MKGKVLVSIMGIVSVFYSCTQAPSLSILCEKDPKGNYILKWEVFPDVENMPIEIYASDNDTLFPSSPLRTVNSSDYIAVVSDTLQLMRRGFFKLKIEGVTSGVISNRYFELDSVQNFRDIGGYYTDDNRQIRWGKVFRSGSFSRITDSDKEELKKLGIKTVLDLRSDDVREKYNNKLEVENYVRVPIVKDGYSSISQRIVNGVFLRGDAVIYSQDIYKDMVDNYTVQFTLLFDYLCDKSNYPIVYNCYLGKDQSGLFTYLLLRALGIPNEIAEDDYLLSNMGIDRAKLRQGVDSLSESRQEALTLLTKTDLSYLKYGISCMRNKSGSVDEYMTKELKLTPDKRKKLKEILLY